MKYFSLFENATFIKNRLDQTAVDCLKFEMSNLLIDERDVERFERGIRNEILEFSKIFPRYTPIRFECYDNGGMGGVRRYSLADGPNITFALFPVRGDYSKSIEDDK